MPWYRKLHWQIITGLILGVIYGVVAATNGWAEWTSNWIAPFGTIFINGLQLIAVPLVLGSLITGVASLSDVRKLSRIGGKTIFIYIATTAVAVTIGLLIVNVTRPGDYLPPESREKLQSQFAERVVEQEAQAGEVEKRGPLQLLEDIVPSNFFESASSNRNMLQVVFVSILFGVGLIQLPKDKAKPLLDVFEGLTAVVIRLVDLIMLIAPIGVFALIARTITELVEGSDVSEVFALLGALVFYALAVVAGLFVHMSFTYVTMLKLFTPLKLKTFFTAMAPVQLVAFSTSSSGATLPLTMERCEEKLGVSEEVTSFVLPLGATVNMDGTALYQAVAAVFIAQALGIDIDVWGQSAIVLTAVLASIGTAAVPGAGIIMLVIILQTINVPSAGIAFIFGVDRILDMLRTVTNVTGDATVSAVVAATEGQLNPPDLSEEGDRIRLKA